jgi:predicted MFS family arabinose efflux permease
LARDRYPAFPLLVLFLINTANFYDRQVLSAVAEPLRVEWRLSDSALGALSTAFTLLYAFAGVPLGRLADTTRRTLVLAGGVFVWSALTAASGLARSFWELFVLRLGVGVGEASCAPAATSLIADLVPRERRARALSVFMLGLPVGLSLSYAVSGTVAEAWGWRAAFFVAGLPGIALAALVLLLREPRRGASEDAAGAATAAGLTNGAPPTAGASAWPVRSPYAIVLGTPTVLWIVVSGALHNFNMYAISSFLSPLLVRVHGLDVREAGFVAMLVYGVAGGLGLLAGGVLGDRVLARREDGRLLLAAGGVLAAIPLLVAALGRPAGDAKGFALLLGLAVALLYVYYAVIYAALQDVVAPALRGTAMALYFFAMYVLGASLGPLATGYLSDRFTASAAASAQSVDLERFRGQGLASALGVVPVLALPLGLVLLAAARTTPGDRRRQVLAANQGR